MVYGANVRAKARTSLSRPILGIQLRHLPGSTEPSGLSMHRRCAQRKFLRFWLPMLTKFFFFFYLFCPTATNPGWGFFVLPQGRFVVVWRACRLCFGFIFWLEGIEFARFWAVKGGRGAAAVRWVAFWGGEA